MFIFQGRRSQREASLKNSCSAVSGVPRPEVVGVGGRGVKPIVYRQWKLGHVTLVKWIKTTATIQATNCRSLDKM